jgi:hypothetical protein
MADGNNSDDNTAFTIRPIFRRSEPGDGSDTIQVTPLFRKKVAPAASQTVTGKRMRLQDMR